MYKLIDVIEFLLHSSFRNPVEFCIYHYLDDYVIMIMITPLMYKLIYVN
jgi:hypothetical protein